MSRVRPIGARNAASTWRKYGARSRCGVARITPFTPSSFGSPPTATSGSALLPGCPSGCGRQSDSAKREISSARRVASKRSGRRMKGRSICTIPIPKWPLYSHIPWASSAGEGEREKMSRQQRRAEERRSSKERRKAALAAMAAMAATSLIAMPADAAGNGKHVHGSLAHWAKQPGAVKARPGKGKHGKKKAVTAAAKKPNLRSGALAASITVNSIADDTTAGNTQCTLREALANANSNSDTTGGD